MVAPTVNSYSRLIPGAWAPTDASWGFENRTCALRGIGGSTILGSGDVALILDVQALVHLATSQEERAVMLASNAG